jgi:hypothetical protein
MSPDTEPCQITPLEHEDRLELARRLYREYYARCFWHRPRDLVITEELIPIVAKGLRQHGGRRGFMLAAELDTPRDADKPSGNR